MISAALFLVILLFAIVVLWWRARVRESSAHPLPPAYPSQLPIIGVTHKLFTDTAKLWCFIKSVALHSVKQGGVTCCKIGFDMYYMITDPEDALTVANTCLQKHFLYGFAENWLGQGLITGSGDRWHRHRKLLNSAFSLPVIHGFLGVFNNQSKVFLNALDPYVGTGPFNPSKFMRELILKISCLTAFGETVDNDKTFYPKYMKSVDEILNIIMQRFQKVWLQDESIYKLLGLKKKEDELVNILNGMSDEIIKKKREDRINETNIGLNLNSAVTDLRYQPFLDIILNLSTKGNLSDQEIREEIDTTIVAAFETTSHFLESVLTVLGSHTEVQEKVYKEVMEVLGADRDVEKEDLQKLVYTDAVLKEILRVIPTVPVIGRYIDKDVKLKNYTLRAKSQCFIFTFGMHRQPSWGPDAEKFRPERWLDPTSLPSNPNAFGAFSLGKRSCIGKTYAMISAKVILSHVIRKYKITGDYTKIQFKLDITLKPETGHEISLERRK